MLRRQSEWLGEKDFCHTVTSALLSHTESVYFWLVRDSGHESRNFVHTWSHNSSSFPTYGHSHKVSQTANSHIIRLICLTHCLIRHVIAVSLNNIFTKKKVTILVHNKHLHLYWVDLISCIIVRYYRLLLSTSGSAINVWVLSDIRVITDNDNANIYSQSRHTRCWDWM